MAVANGVGDNELCSGACGERAEEGRAFEKVRGGQGAAWRLQVVEEASREAGGGGSRRWLRLLCVRHVAVLLAKEGDDWHLGCGGLAQLLQ